MQEVNGIFLPDGDTHFPEAIKASPFWHDGRGTYQYAKLTNALTVVPETRRGLAVDVGGHVGLWSRILHAHFKRVVAFEPVPALAECFRLNAPGVELHEVALAHEEATAVGFVTISENSGNSRFAVRGDIAPNICVLMKTLDSFKLAPDFLKIDVEGFELNVIEGARETIAQHQPVIVVEQKPGHAQRYGFGETQAVDVLKSWGYAVAWKKSGDFCMKWGK